MATSDKLQKLLETKEQIRQAIIDKGVEVGEDIVFADYPNKIAAIESSGGGSLTKEQSDIINAWNQRTINGTSLENLYSNYYKNSSGNVVDLDLQYIDFSKVTTISSMFSNNSIKSIIIRNMDTSNINIMSFVFYQVTNLTELDLSDWYTPNVTSVKYMFGLCRNLETVNISNFDLTNCSSASYIFQNCSKLHTLRLDNCSNDTINKIITSSSFPTGTIDGVQRKIFVNPDNIGDLTAPDGWVFVDSDGNEIVPEPEIPLYQPDMFRDNRDIEEVSVMVTSEHDNLESMFQGCENLRTINGINEWDTSNVTNMQSMFYNCRSLESLDLSNFRTSNVESMWDMFSECENLKELNLSSFEIREDCSTDYMLNNCRRLHTLHLEYCNEDTIRKIIESEEFPTGKAEDHDETRKIFVKKGNVDKLTAPNGWVFVDCKTGEIIEGKPVNYEGGMFHDNRDIEKVNVMVTKEHTDLGDMFSECENLKTINGIKDWNTSNVENMNSMFFNCKSLESLDLSSFNTSQVTTMDTMFFNCENLRELNLSNFEIREDCNTNLMFMECRRLHTLRLDNCSRETVERIINSSNFPTGRAEDYDETRKIYIRSFDSVIQPPDGWEFEYVY